jgi:phosphate transport system substrate-binding protein
MRYAMIGIAFAAALLTGAKASAGELKMQGAGATFPAPFYARLVEEYQKLHPDVKIDYQAIGSGGGIKAITDCTVDFAGSDAPLNDKQLEACGKDNIVQVPSCAGGVVPAYNVPGVTQDLNFTGEVLANIYLGKVNNWSDPAIKSLNPGVALPNLAITPVWRTDGSGTTYVWTNYLCTQSMDFSDNIGSGTSVSWPVGQGGKGNQGVAAVLQVTKGAIGYVEENYADKNNIAYGAVRNKAGKFIKASPESVSKAGTSAAEQMSGSVLKANMWNGDGEGTYPIASLTYLIVYKDLKNVDSMEKAKAITAYLWWATHEGQKYASDLDYAPLASEVQKKVEKALSGLVYKGRPVQ